MVTTDDPGWAAPLFTSGSSSALTLPAAFHLALHQIKGLIGFVVRLLGPYLAVSETAR